VRISWKRGDYSLPECENQACFQGGCDIHRSPPVSFLGVRMAVILISGMCTESTLGGWRTLCATLINNCQNRLIWRLRAALSHPTVKRVTEGELSSHHIYQRSDGRWEEDHFAQHCSPLGYTGRFTLRLSNLMSDSSGRSGVTLRSIPFSPTQDGGLLASGCLSPRGISHLEPRAPLTRTAHHCTHRTPVRS